MKKLRKIGSILMAVVMAVSIVAVPKSGLVINSVEATSFTYDPNKAIARATEELGKNNGDLCAAFVARCVRAGGINISVHTGTGPLYRAIGQAIGVDLGTYATRAEYNRNNLSALSTLTLDKNGHARETDNRGVMTKGDVVIQWCFGCHIAPHVLLFGGYDKDGIARYYAKNRSLNYGRYNLSSNSQHTKSTCRLGGKVIQLSNSSTPPVQNFTLSYNANGGSGTPSSQTGTTLTISNTRPTRNGHTFVGWSTSSSATSANHQPGGRITLSGNTTLYAVWQPNTQIPSTPTGLTATRASDTTARISWNAVTGATSYQVEYWSPNNNRWIADSSYRSGTSYISTGLSIHPSYTYRVWAVNSAGISPWAEVTVTMSVNHTLSYNANGGFGVPSSQTGTTININNTRPTRNGFTFLGWSESASAAWATYQPGDRITLSKNTTLYAVWQVNEIACTHPSYDSNGFCTNASCKAEFKINITPMTATLYADNDGTPIRNRPYDGTSVDRRVNKGDSVTITGSGNNSQGVLYYVVSGGGWVAGYHLLSTNPYNNPPPQTTNPPPTTTQPTTPSTPTGLTVKSANTNGSNALVSWNAALGATWYELQWYSASRGEWRVDHEHSLTPRTATSFTVIGLSNVSSMRFRVRAHNSVGSSSWAEITYYK
ncbi:MAG: InlB B-repeat-containing protein [Oscillospiraceae bacterium]|nr:InlB B-repeat-containing protein [Oscillospiraceae bacterium]